MRMTDDLEAISAEVFDEHPAVDPARRRKALQAFERAAAGQQQAEYWRRVELAARERWARGRSVSRSELSALVRDARDFVDEIDRQHEEDGER